MANRSYNNLYITIPTVLWLPIRIPSDTDLVFDVQIPSNPYYVDELRPKTGERQREMREYVMQNGTAAIFLDKLLICWNFWSGYVLEGKKPAGCAIWILPEGSTAR